MHRLPADFDASFLVGRKLELVGFAAHQIYLHFDAGMSITVESAYSCRKSQQPALRVQIPVQHSD